MDGMLRRSSPWNIVLVVLGIILAVSNISTGLGISTGIGTGDGTSTGTQVDGGISIGTGGISVVKDELGTTFCRKDDTTLQIEYSFTDKDDKIEVVYVFENDLCKGEIQYLCPIEGTGEDSDPFLISVDVSLSTKLEIPTPKCGVTHSNDVWTFSVLTRADANTELNKQTRGDTCRKVQCIGAKAFDTSNLDGALTKEVDSSGLFDNPLFPIMESQPRIELHVYNADSDPYVPGQAMNTELFYAKIGQKAYLSMQFWRGMYPSGRDTAGKLYYFAFPEIVDGGLTKEYHLLITTTTSIGTDVKITYYSGATYDYIAEHNVVLDVDVDTTDVLKIESHDDVSVVALLHDTTYYSAATLIPTDSLYIMHYCAAQKDSNIMVIGTQDDTLVEITLPATAGLSVGVRGEVYSTNQVFSYTIHEMDKLYLESMLGDITGTKIFSSKPVVVLASHAGEKGLTPIGQLLTPIPPSVTMANKYVYFGLPDTATQLTNYKILSLTNQNNQLRDYNNDGSTNVLTTFTSDAQLYSTSLSSEDFRVIESDHPIALVQLAPNKNNNDDVRAMTYIPPMEQWSSFYFFPVSDDANIKTSLIIVAANGDGYGKGNDISLDSVPLTSTWKPIGGPVGAGFVWCQKDVTPGVHILQHHQPNVTFMATLYGTRDDNKALAYSYNLPGGRMMQLEPHVSCTPQPGVDGDLLDNDCDGRTDEETRNNKDDDGDGKVDEDTATLWDDKFYAVGVRPKNCYVSAFPTFDEGLYTRKIIIENGCKNPDIKETMAFYFNLDFKRDTLYDYEPMVAKSGLFEMARFSLNNANEVYFGCEYDTCNLLSDYKCRHLMCDQSRRKRETGTSSTGSFAYKRVQIGSGEYQPIFTEHKTDILDDCPETTVFLVVVLVLVALLLVAVAMTIVFLKRLRQT